MSPIIKEWNLFCQRKFVGLCWWESLDPSKSQLGATEEPQLVAPDMDCMVNKLQASTDIKKEKQEK